MEGQERLDGLRIEARTALAMLYRLRDRFAEDAGPALMVEIGHYRSRIREIENRLKIPPQDRMTHGVRGWSPWWQCPVSDWLKDFEKQNRLFAPKVPA